MRDYVHDETYLASIISPFKVNFHNWQMNAILLPEIVFPRQSENWKHRMRFKTAPGRRATTALKYKSVFYYFCLWHLRGRDPRYRESSSIFRRERRSRKRSGRIRPPFAFAVVKKAKSDRLSPDNKDSPKDKATLSRATETGRGGHESLCFK